MRYLLEAEYQALMRVQRERDAIVRQLTGPAPDHFQTVEKRAQRLVDLAAAAGLVLTITDVGNGECVVNVRPRPREGQA